MNENTPRSSASLVMTIVFWLLVLVVLSFFFNQLLEKFYNPNQQLRSVHEANGVISVELQRNRQGHYVSSGQINGQPVVFMLDTGATMVSVPESLAQSLGLSRGAPLRVRTASGEATVYATTLNTVSVGDITLNTVRAAINPHDDSDDILLGMAFLKQLEFTQRGDTLTLRQYPN